MFEYVSLIFEILSKVKNIKNLLRYFKVFIMTFIFKNADILYQKKKKRYIYGS